MLHFGTNLLPSFIRLCTDCRRSGLSRFCLIPAGLTAAWPTSNRNVMLAVWYRLLLLRLRWGAGCALLWWWVRRARGGTGSFPASFQEVQAAKDQWQGPPKPRNAYCLKCRFEGKANPKPKTQKHPEAWTIHLYESFFFGCIPVLLSDEAWAFGV